MSYSLPCKELKSVVELAVALSEKMISKRQNSDSISLTLPRDY